MSTNNNPMRFCAECGKEYSRKAYQCPHCGCPNDANQGKKTKDNPIMWIPTLFFPLFFILSKSPARAWTARILVLFAILAAIAGNSVEEQKLSDRTVSSCSGGSETTSTSSSREVSTTKKSSYADKFSGDCGISATGKMGTDVIGQPTLSVDIFNKTEKTIAAIKFHFIPLDVYGEENKGFFAQNSLFTQSDIRPNESYSANWTFIDNNIKRGKLLVYSVYFSDGSEWGDKDASRSNARQYGVQVEVNGSSR